MGLNVKDCLPLLSNPAIEWIAEVLPSLHFGSLELSWQRAWEDRAIGLSWYVAMMTAGNSIWSGTSGLVAL